MLCIFPIATPPHITEIKVNANNKQPNTIEATRAPFDTAIFLFTVLQFICAIYTSLQFSSQSDLHVCRFKEVSQSWLTYIRQKTGHCMAYVHPAKNWSLHAYDQPAHCGYEKFERVKIHFAVFNHLYLLFSFMKLVQTL